MAIAQFIEARDRLIAVLDSEADTTKVLRETVSALHAVTTFSWCALMTVDPQTLLPSGAVVEGYSPENCAPFWENELLAPGFNKFSALARNKDAVATLFDATDGDLDRARPYTDLFAPIVIADELRAAFVVGTSCWGVVSLTRASADGPFPDSEVDEVRGLAPFIARALKARACKLDADALSPAAMIVVGAGNEIQNATVEARSLLDDLRTGGVNEPGLPTIIGAIATRARSSGSSTHEATRVRGVSERWLRVTAAPMEGGDGQVAVMIEPARVADLTPILLESYGLTEREAEIVILLARGLATKEIAAELSLSAHTVRDHVKAIFEKAGVNSRGELVANIFAEHLLDGFHSAVHHVG